MLHACQEQRGTHGRLRRNVWHAVQCMLRMDERGSVPVRVRSLCEKVRKASSNGSTASSTGASTLACMIRVLQWMRVHTAQTCINLYLSLSLSLGIYI